MLILRKSRSECESVVVLSLHTNTFTIAHVDNFGEKHTVKTEVMKNCSLRSSFFASRFMKRSEKKSTQVDNFGTKRE